MKLVRPVRLPLQVGTSALWAQVGWAASWLPAIAGIALLGLVPYWLGFAGPVGGMIGLWLGTLAWLLLLALAFSFREDAALRRPADVVLASAGLTIDGGRYHGLHLGWRTVAAAEVVIVTKPDDRSHRLWTIATAPLRWLLRRVRVRLRWLDVARFEIHELRVGAVAIAAADRAGEQASLAHLRDSIAAAATRRRAAAAVRATRSDLLACSACAAPVAPDDADQVACHHCGAAVPVPARLRAAVQVPRDASAAGALALRLLAQPSASWSQVRLSAARVVMMLAWPLAVGLQSYLWATGNHGARSTLLVAALVPALIVGAALLARVHLADRHALRLLTLELGARAPTTDGAPYGCCRCAAPLPDGHGATLVRCAYCHSDNVIGVDLSAEARPVHDTKRSLEHALARRRRERRRWLGAGALGLAAVIGASYGGVRALTIDTPTARALRACRQGELETCFRYARGLVFSDEFAGSHRADARDDDGLALLRATCARGHRGACVVLARMLHAGHGVSADRELARAALAALCGAGPASPVAPACELFATMCRRRSSPMTCKVRPIP